MAKIPNEVTIAVRWRNERAFREFVAAIEAAREAADEPWRGDLDLDDAFDHLIECAGRLKAITE